MELAIINTFQSLLTCFFLKIAHENGSEEMLPEGYRWADLFSYDGDNLLGHYQELLTHLGSSAASSMVRDIYAFPTTVFSHSENLRVILEGLVPRQHQWHRFDVVI
jgi:type I restriction enzyme M protein